MCGTHTQAHTHRQAHTGMHTHTHTLDDSYTRGTDGPSAQEMPPFDILSVSHMSPLVTEKGRDGGRERDRDRERGVGGEREQEAEQRRVIA